MSSTLDDRRRPRGLRLESPEVISRRACLEEPTLTLRLRDERGVKNFLNRLGVTVGSCVRRLLLFLPEVAGVGNDCSFPSGVVALSIALRSVERRGLIGHRTKTRVSIIVGLSSIIARLYRNEIAYGL